MVSPPVRDPTDMRVTFQLCTPSFKHAKTDTGLTDTITQPVTVKIIR